MQIIGDMVNNTLLRPGTNRTYASLWKKWIAPFTGVKGIDNDFLTRQVKFWLEEIGLAPRTVKILIRLFCEEVNKTGSGLDPKPITRQVMKRVQTKEIKALSKEQLDILLHNTKFTKLYSPVLLAAHTGMRRGEVWGLRWEDVHFNRRRILVNNSYGGPTKNGKSRMIPMSQTIFDHLSVVKLVSSDTRVHVIREQFDPNPLLKDICKRLHIPIVNFHALRHTFATLALEAGTSPKKVQETLGHSALSTTLNIYWSSTQEEMDLEFLS